MKVNIDEVHLDNIQTFCQNTRCCWCPFGESGYYTVTECLIGKPEYWEVEEEE